MFSRWDSPKTLSENAALKLKTNLSFFTESILICHFRKSTYVIIKLKKRAEFHYGSHRSCQSQSNDNSWYSGHVYVMQPFVISYLCLFYYKMFAVKRVFSSLLNDCCFFLLDSQCGEIKAVRITLCHQIVTSFCHFFL